MTVDVHFGKLATEVDEDGVWEHAEWPGDPHEDDGTSEEHTIYSRRPIRSFSNSGFADWVERVPEARAIAYVCYTADRVATPIDATLLKLIKRLPAKGLPGDVDRGKWFKYWSRRAVETFGSDAIIFFS